MMKHVQPLVDEIRDHPLAFYRDTWGSAASFDDLPTISRADFLRVPLSRRRYKEEKGLVKIVHTEEGAFLSEWSFADIGREEFGKVSKRPMVYLTDPHEAIEKSMWCYERGMVPLVGERDHEVAMYAASQYKIDSLIADCATLAKASAYIRAKEPLASISILGDSFNIGELLQYADLAREMRLVLTLPETGAFAHAALEAAPVYSALPGCILERKDTIVVTKGRLLATPIIRFKTGIQSDMYDGSF